MTGWMRQMILLSLGFLAPTFLFTACTIPPPGPLSSDHIQAPSAKIGEQEIPEFVTASTILPTPSAQGQEELYTVVLNNVPIREVLFALAKESKINVSIHPGIQGQVTVNAIDQTLPQILDQIAENLNMTYHFKGNNLIISQDTPYWHVYNLDYLNIERTADSSMGISGNVGSTTTSGGNSSINVSNKMFKTFWQPLIEGIENIVKLDEDQQKLMAEKNAEAEAEAETESQINSEFDGQKKGVSKPTTKKTTTKSTTSSNSPVVPHIASGVINVFATKHQHQQVQTFLDQISLTTHRQVLIEATIMEVSLTQDHQQGVDWSRITNVGNELSMAFSGSGSTSLTQSTMGSVLGITPLGGKNPMFTMTHEFSNDSGNSVTATIKALEEFGNVTVLSSPKVMTMNNQQALLKVVEELVYFDIKITDAIINQETGNITTPSKKTATPTTVSEGMILGVIPQISENNTVILNIRPSISSVVSWVDDPINAGNKIPQMAVREMESVLRVPTGHTAILGGLMTDKINKNSKGVPLLSDAPLISDLFKYKQQEVEKTELVILLRPTVITSENIAQSVHHIDSIVSERNKP
ncbi:MAG: hypothetical protein H7832_12190 [Magnetococcus sp. DMHC-6]